MREHRMNVVTRQLRSAIIQSVRATIHRRGFSAKLGALSLFASLLCSNATAESLSTALDLAIKSNPQLELARASIATQEKGVSIARSGKRPTLYADATATYDEYENDSLSMGRLGLQLDQALYDGRATRSATKSAQALLSSANAQLAITTQQIILDSVTSYTDVRRDVELIQIGESNLSFLNDQISLVKQRITLGSATKTELSQANAQQAEAVAQLAAANANLQSSRANYHKVIGVSPAELAPAQIPDTLLPKTLEEASTFSNAEHPLLKKAMQTAKSAQHGIDLAKSALRPTVGLSARLERLQNDLPTSDQRHQDGVNTSISIQLRVPIYQAGLATARVHQSRDVLMQRQQEVLIIQRMILADIETAWHQFIAAKAIVEASNTQLDAARFARDGKLREQSVGIASMQDVLLSQQDVLAAQVAIPQSRRDVVIAAYRLLHATGQLNLNIISHISAS